jgi:hypothetical protein
MHVLQIKSNQGAKYGEKSHSLGNKAIFITKTDAKFPEIAGTFDVIEDIPLRANSL